MTRLAPTLLLLALAACGPRYECFRQARADHATPGMRFGLVGLVADPPDYQAMDTQIAACEAAARAPITSD